MHAVRHWGGQVIVINHAPAEVCSVCGDIILKPETVGQNETLLRTTTRPAGMVPLYEYA